MAAPAQKGRGARTYRTPRGKGVGQTQFQGPHWTVPPRRVDLGILWALQRFRQSGQQEGQEAIGISKTSD